LLACLLVLRTYYYWNEKSDGRTEWTAAVSLVVSLQIIQRTNFGELVGSSSCRRLLLPRPFIQVSISLHHHVELRCWLAAAGWVAGGVAASSSASPSFSSPRKVAVLSFCWRLFTCVCWCGDRVPFVLLAVAFCCFPPSSLLYAYYLFLDDRHDPYCF